MKRKIGIFCTLILLITLFALPGCSNGSSGYLGMQLEKPEEGEEIAVLETNMGTIKIRLFPEEAPKTVQNFKELIQKGYYDGITFHRVIEGFMIQGGDPTATGTGGESAFGEDFEDEFSKNLVNIRGSLAMANSGPNTNSSQFFINQAGPEEFAGWDYFQSAYDSYKSNEEMFTSIYGYNWPDMGKVTDAYKKLYEENGGNPNLDGAYAIGDRGHTVFGQVFEGMDVVDAIAAVKTDPDTDKPLDDVVIEKAEIVEYHAE